jgi:putative SOS response-associated peptidase YedK
VRLSWGNGVDTLSEAHDRTPVIIAGRLSALAHWFRPEGQKAARLYTGGPSPEFSDRVNELKRDDVGLIAPLAGPAAARSLAAE